MKVKSFLHFVLKRKCIILKYVGVFQRIILGIRINNINKTFLEYIVAQVVDSIMALFRVDFSGRGELADRQQKLAQMLSRLQKVSEEYNVAVFITNQMTSDPGATLTFQVRAIQMNY